jgi:hypothetical protein
VENHQEFLAMLTTATAIWKNDSRALETGVSLYRRRT